LVVALVFAVVVVFVVFRGERKRGRGTGRYGYLYVAVGCSDDGCSGEWFAYGSTVVEVAASGVWRHGCCWCVGRLLMVRTKIGGGSYRFGGVTAVQYVGRLQRWERRRRGAT
jgi:hypothetical protein